jgi:glycosyltransferase involved in cell wall biosynthesis
MKMWNRMTGLRLRLPKINNLRTQVLYSSKENANSASVAIIIPYYNQAKLIERNLSSIIDNLELLAELVVIDDSSTDNTLEVLLNFIKHLGSKQKSKLVSIKILYNQASEFETYCDSVLIDNCNTKHIIEIQSDMQILQKGFDTKLLSAICADPRLIAVSARGVQPIIGILNGYSNNLGSVGTNAKTMLVYLLKRVKYHLRFLVSYLKSRQPLDFSKFEATHSEEMDADFLSTGSAGRLGMKICRPLDKFYASKKILYIGETIMRGPIIIDKDKYYEVGGLDVKGFFLGYDEHDLFARAYLECGYRVGFTPLDFSSPLEDGTMRKRRTLKNELQIWIKLLHIRKTRKLTTLYKLNLENKRPIYSNEIVLYD